MVKLISHLRYIAVILKININTRFNLAVKILCFKTDGSLFDIFFFKIQFDLIGTRDNPVAQIK